MVVKYEVGRNINQVDVSITIFNWPSKLPTWVYILMQEPYKNKLMYTWYQPRLYKS